MHLVWIAPVTIAGIAVAAVAAAAARAVEEARRLEREVRRFAELRPALVELRDATARAQVAAQALRRRS